MVEREMDRIRGHFALVTLPLDNVSFVTPTLDSDVTERRILLRHYHVHKKYLQQHVQREANDQMSILVLAWYNMRFIEIRRDIRKAFECS